MTHPPEPIPDLSLATLACPECGFGDIRPLGNPRPFELGWRCDHCRITWTPDGTGGEQT